jgi:DNA-binding IscR family transcriptional regulator
VARLIDGPLAPIACVSQTAYERCSCPDEEHCGLRMLMLDVRNAISNILDRFTLADVVEVTMRKLRKDKVAIPFVLDPLLARPISNPKSRKRPKKVNGQTVA